MPLSKEKNRERMRQLRAVQPKLDNPTEFVQPNWLLHPTKNLSFHMRICPDYNPLHPGDHFDHCPLSNPKPIFPNSPDGRRYN